MMIMTDVEIFEEMRHAGFPGPVAVSMTAIALRESAGEPGVFNSKPPDRSYGLLQINMYGTLDAGRMKLFGLAAETELLQPDVNARAGYILWAGNNANLETAWAIHLPGYKERYEAMLPRAQAAALASPLGV